MSEVKNYFILTATCRARTGVIAAVTSFLADRGCYISTLEQFDDEFTDKFFCVPFFGLNMKHSQSILYWRISLTLPKNFPWIGKYMIHALQSKQL